MLLNPNRVWARVCSSHGREQPAEFEAAAFSLRLVNRSTDPVFRIVAQNLHKDQIAMSRNHAPVMIPLEVLHLLRAKPRRWIASVAIFGLVAAVYAVLRPNTGDARAESPARAVALTATNCKELQARSQEVRDLKARSSITDLMKTAELARVGLSETTEKLTKVESHAGTDLGELRLLNDTNGEHELREAHQAIEANQELLAVLTASENDAGSLTAAPNRLLDSQSVLLLEHPTEPFECTSFATGPDFAHQAVIDMLPNNSPSE
jgi:hypothetical protein